MSIFLKTTGAALILLGLGIAATLFTKPGVLDALGIRLDTAALLLIGGILVTGQSALVDAFKGRSHAKPAAEVAAPVAVIPNSAVSVPNAFGRKPEGTGLGLGATTVAAAGVAGAGFGAMAAKAAPKDSVADTISALEQAKADVIKSMGGMDPTTQAAAPSKAEVQPVVAAAHEVEPAAVDEETAEMEDGLFVVEEKVIRGRAARILSDDTVEAETEEGWMRFENLDHLNEYLDSVEEQSA